MDVGWVSFAGLILGFISYAVGITMYVARIELAGHRAMEANRARIFSQVETELLKESKLRHDLAGRMQLQVSGVDADVRLLREKMDEMVHKEDLYAVEARISASIDKLEQRLFRGERKYD